MAPSQEKKKLSFQLVNFNRRGVVNLLRRSLVNLDRRSLVNLNRRDLVNYTGFSTLALGRKNYLFAGSDDSAQRAAIVYSLFATCRLHRINPYDWLTDVFQRIKDQAINKISELLPQNWKKSNASANVELIS